MNSVDEYDGSGLPAEAVQRIERHRSKLGANGWEFGSGHEYPKSLSIAEPVNVLVHRLPTSHESLVSKLVELKDRLPTESRIRIVVRTQPFSNRSIIGRVPFVSDWVSSGEGNQVDVPNAVRDAGLMIGSIDRFRVEHAGKTELWVDLEAINFEDGASLSG